MLIDTALHISESIRNLFTSIVDSPHFQAKGDFNTLLLQGHTTPFITMAIQIALNRKINAGLVTDSIWGAKPQQPLISSDYKKVIIHLQESLKNISFTSCEKP